MKRKDGIREKPKQKSFIRGGFCYNPEVDRDVWRGCRSECTTWMAKPDSLDQVWRLCQHRARYARLEARARRRLLRGVWPPTA